MTFWTKSLRHVTCVAFCLRLAKIAQSNQGTFAPMIKDSLASILAQSEFTQAMPLTGMSGDALPTEAPGHPALRFERILNDATIGDLAVLNCVSYDVPVETGLSLVKEHTLWREHAYGFVAYEADKPVSTATAIVNEGCIYLFLVATVPMRGAKDTAKPCAVMPCRQPIMRRAFGGACCMPQKQDTQCICVLDTNRL
jgi:hypothetical protein